MAMPDTSSKTATQKNIQGDQPFPWYTCAIAICTDIIGQAESRNIEHWMKQTPSFKRQRPLKGESVAVRLRHARPQGHQLVSQVFRIWRVRLASQLIHACQLVLRPADGRIGALKGSAPSWSRAPTRTHLLKHTAHGIVAFRAEIVSTQVKKQQPAVRMLDVFVVHTWKWFPQVLGLGGQNTTTVERPSWMGQCQTAICSGEQLQAQRGTRMLHSLQTRFRQLLHRNKLCDAGNSCLQQRIVSKWQRSMVSGFQIVSTWTWCLKFATSAPNSSTMRAEVRLPVFAPQPGPMHWLHPCALPGPHCAQQRTHRTHRGKFETSLPGAIAPWWQQRRQPWRCHPLVLQTMTSGPYHPPLWHCHGPNIVAATCARVYYNERRNGGPDHPALWRFHGV